MRQAGSASGKNRARPLPATSAWGKPEERRDPFGDACSRARPRIRGAANRRVRARCFIAFSQGVSSAMNDRFNTIAGWLLGGGIVLLGATLVTGELFHSERPESMGYPIEGVEEEGGEGKAAEPPIAALLATADAGRGANSFKKCTACHTITPGGPSGVGPNIHGIMGQPLAARGFAYSDALKSKGGNWDWEAMNAWLRSPRAFANGTKMTFAGIGDPQERADLILYLNQQGSNLPLPAAPASSDDPADASQVDARTNTAAPAVKGAAPDQPVLNESQGPNPPKGGGEARPDSNNPGGN